MAMLRQTNFSTGEVTPEICARSDLTKYAAALAACKNFIVTQHGGATKRPGTGMVHEVKNSAAAVRFVPFIFSNDQSFVLELGNLYVRFYVDGGLLLASGAAAYNPATTYAKDDYVTYAGLSYRARSATLGNQPDVSPGYWIQQDIYEITTPYVTADLAHLKFAQVGDIIFFASQSRAPQEIRRYSNTHWAWAASAFGKGTGENFPTNIALYGAPNYVGDATHPVRPWGWTVATVYANGSEVCAPFYYGNDTLAAAYNGATTYAEGDYVLSGGAIWRSLQAANTGNAPAGSPTWWTAAVRGPVAVYPDLASAKATIQWDPVADGPSAGQRVISYRIYRTIFDIDGYSPGIGGLVGEILNPTAIGGKVKFTDTLATPDYTQQPPKNANPWDSDGNGSPDDFPAVVAFFDERRTYANTPKYPGRLFASKVGVYTSYDDTLPPLDDELVDFTLASRRFEEIRSLVPLGILFACTGGTHWAISGDQGGPITPSSLLARPAFYSGVSWLDPIPIGQGYLSVQEKGTVIRDIAAQLRQTTSGGFTNGYTGDDLSLLARHLFKGYSVVDWAYARDPFYVIWVVRSDGALLGLTYLKELEMVAWHRHDVDGKVENVCVIPEGDEDAVYLVVNRTIGGATKRYVERMATRTVTDVRTGIFLDSALSYDGTVDPGILASMVGFADVVAGTPGSIHTTGPAFAPASVGKQAWLNVSTAAPVKCAITAYVATNQVTVELVEDIAATLVANGDWGIATDTLTGLDHLEGETVGVLGDGAPLSSAVVAGGQIVVETPVLFAVVGLAYDSDLETLDASPQQAEMRTQYKAIPRVLFEVIESRGLEAGEDFNHLLPWKQRDTSDNFGAVGLAARSLVEVRIQQTANKGGRAVLRHSDPLPLTVLSFIREVEVGGS